MTAQRTVATIQARLTGPRRLRTELLQEVADGLEDATEAYQEAGLNAADAERRAVAEFGDPRKVADQLQEEIAARHGRRSALFIALCFPVLILAWDLLWMTGLVPPTPQPAPAVLLNNLLTWIAVTTTCGALVGFLLLYFGPRVGVAGIPVTRAIGVLGWLGTGSTVLACCAMQFTQPNYADRMLNVPVLSVMVLSLVLVVGVATAAQRCCALATAP
ncbi:hypothetical protein EV191_1011227 [Tamaricihabitans halophyticus]|uniref:Uncharacterized protein n=1 Tax=Tamaricihabitans halophyticus TaxID=1262583 RepID=A0A4R2R5K3_9PSEU|nr:permease prefix domain 1-containing protein [Tamaricihabitans halophyticus]TCP57274.1 hypothetical protein EV191_1011227 [Tamaricihabitans halophyticus]